MPENLWNYCETVYADGVVSRCCLALQEHYQANVNFLLMGAWLAKQRLCLSVDAFSGLEESIDIWHQQAVLPLRELRQQLKIWQTSHPELAALREQIKSAELATEQWEICQLEQTIGTLDSGGYFDRSFLKCLQLNLMNYSQAAQLPEDFCRCAEYHELVQILDAIDRANCEMSNID